MRRSAVLVACIGIVLALVGPVSAASTHVVRLPLVATDNVTIPADDIPDGAPIVSFWPEPGIPAVLGYATPGYNRTSIAWSNSPLMLPDGFFVDIDSDYSAYNPEANHPPKLCTQIGEPYRPAMCLPGGEGGWAPTICVTKNRAFESRVDPDELLAHLGATRRD